MRRQLLWVPIVLFLGAGCATRPASDADVLVSRIAHERASKLVCESGEVQWCQLDLDRQKHCQCMDSRALLGH